MDWKSMAKPPTLSKSDILEKKKSEKMNLEENYGKKCFFLHKKVMFIVGPLG